MCPQNGRSAGGLGVSGVQHGSMANKLKVEGDGSLGYGGPYALCSRRSNPTLSPRLGLLRPAAGFQSVISP